MFLTETSLVIALSIMIKKFGVFKRETAFKN
jgi:hypothetical protein